MIRRFFIFAIAGLLSARAAEEVPSPSGASPLAWNAIDHSPRSLALELARGNGSEGYQVHDGFWSGTLAKGDPMLLEVYLFAGNDYRFSAANLDAYSQVSLSIFDSWGYPAGQEFTGNSSCATAGISVYRSGRYFIRLIMREGDNADICMIYSYK